MLATAAAYWIILLGESMEPTYPQGYSYEYTPLADSTVIARNDVVVIRQGRRYGGLQLKRVVGVPGDSLRTVRLPRPEKGYSAAVIRRARYYVIGDNIRNSRDSRQYGTIHRRHIVGKLKDQR